MKNSRKEELELKIESTMLFSIDKDEDSELYEREKVNLAELLYTYVAGGDVLNFRTEFNEQIYEAIKDTIKYYSRDKGESIVHYFNSILPGKIAHAKGKANYDDIKKGMTGTLSNADIKKVRAYVKYANSIGVDPNNTNAIATYSPMVDMDIEELTELVNIYYNVKPIGEVITDKEGNDRSTIDMIADKSFDIDANQYGEYMLDMIESCYHEFDSNATVQGIISKCLTIKLINELSIDELISAWKTRKIIDKAVLVEFAKNHRVVQQKEVAEFYRVSAVYVTNTFNKYKARLSDMLRQQEA